MNTTNESNENREINISSSYSPWLQDYELLVITSAKEVMVLLRF